MSAAQTILVTDVVDSTQLNEALGDAVMGPLWKAHDTATRHLIEVWHGQEVARSDGFLVLFQSAADALAFALAYHDALRSLDTPLNARVGVHVGPVSLRQNSELDRMRGAPPFEIDGVALPLVARVMATAKGGQTLLTGAAVLALGATPLRIASHGHWRLKGLSEPIELFEVGDDRSPFEPPPDSAKAYRVVRTFGEWAPARKIPNNLPAERDTFVGRSDALSTLEKLLDGPARLVTLLGIGGVGKTRLAIRYARKWLGNYPGGAYFCDLSTARNLDGIFAAASHALDIQLGKGDPGRQISTALAARGECLLVLDNFEQVAREAEATLGVWLEHAPEVKFVATSREVLGIVGEQAQVLAPLEVGEASELFTRRATAAFNHFAPSPTDSKAIAALVRLLDGLPLAIELAAARSRLMSPKMLLDRMKERFTLLAARGGRVDRQMTLRTTLDWSWDLLSLPEKSALAQLSVFEGGFTLEAFEAVFRFDGNESRLNPLDLLQSLLDKSFVRQVGNDRLDLLQTVQEYAAQHLQSAGRFQGSGPEAAADAEKRHGNFFAGLSEESVTGCRCLELDNLSAACRRAAGRRDHVVATQTLALAWSALELRGPFELGLDLSALVLAIPDLPDVARPFQVRGAALNALGRIQESDACFESALAAARARSDPVSEAAALSSLGTLNANAGRTDAARDYLSAALTLARATKSPALECRVLNGLGSLNEALGRTDAARQDYETALALARRIESKRWEGGLLGNLGNVLYAQGRVAEACASCEAGLEIARQLGNRKFEGNALCNLGLMRHLQGDSDSARPHLERALQLAREMGHARLEAIVLCNLGITEEASSNAAGGQAHLESALAVAHNLGDRRTQGLILGYLGLLHCRLGRFNDGRQLIEQAKGHLKTIGNETDLAMLLCQSAEGYALAKARDAASVEFVAATKLAAESGEGETYELKIALERVRLLLAQERTVLA
jgi:predicted ATPase/class 3 adenylate cyclase/Tfp pilus assembly protein PilF